MTDTITINRLGDTPSEAGPADYFTGAVRIEQRFRGTGAARISGATVIFAPGARTAWHTHPLGQTLVVTAGLGRIQLLGGPVQEIRPGDTVWIPAGLKHWHGAAEGIGMIHIAFAEEQDGKSVDWLEQVTDAEYTA